jgi:hypothetical protein
VFLSDGSSKTLQKTFCKKIVSKSFYNKIDKNPKQVWEFTIKTPQKNIKTNKYDPGPLLASDLPTYLPTGVPDLFWGGPLQVNGHHFREQQPWIVSLKL